MMVEECMNRTFTCLTVLAMMMLADALCIKQTIEFRDAISNSTVAMLITAEGLVAGVLVASSISLFRKRLARQKKPLNRRPVAAAAQA